MILLEARARCDTPDCGDEVRVRWPAALTEVGVRALAPLDALAGDVEGLPEGWTLDRFTGAARCARHAEGA